MDFNRLMKRIKEERNFLRKKELLPLDTYRSKVYSAIHLNVIVELKKPEPRIRYESRKNLIINVVTAAENFFKDVAKALPTSPILKKYERELLNNKLFDETLKLRQAFELFSSESASIGLIVSAYYSFENLEQINSVFSAIIWVYIKDFDFLNHIGKLRVKTDKYDREDWMYEWINSICLDKDLPNWRSEVGQFFELRHEYVHHISFKDKLGKDRIAKMNEVFDAFITVSNYFFLDFFSDNESEATLLKPQPVKKRNNHT